MAFFLAIDPPNVETDNLDWVTHHSDLVLLEPVVYAQTIPIINFDDIAVVSLFNPEHLFLPHHWSLDFQLIKQLHKVIVVDQVFENRCEVLKSVELKV